MFFIAGITGHVGGAAARQLLAQGHKLRTLLRDPGKAAAWAQQGVEIHQGDLNDTAAVAKALDGVEGAFLMLPPIMVPAPGFPGARAIIASFEQALRQSPPPRVVFLSSIGSQQTERLGLITSTHLLEQALGDLAFPSAFIRAGSFMENYGYGLGQAEASGFFDVFSTPTSRAIPLIASADIGALVAQLLADGWHGKKIVELGTRYSPDDVAAALGQVLGKQVQARAIPRDQWTAGLEHMGMPPGSTGMYEEMLDGVNSGWIDFGVPGTESVAGTITPAEFFAAMKDG